MKFPTLLQTWFVNYLESVSNFSDHLEVLSLLDGENPYDSRIDGLPIDAVHNTRFGEQPAMAGALFYLAKNLHKNRSRKFIKNALLNKMPLRDKLVCLQFSKLLDIHHPDIIHCHSEKAAYRFLALLKSLDSPIYLTFHGLPPEGVRDLTPKQRHILYSNIDFVVTNTQFSKEQCENLVPNIDEIHVIPQGISINDFPYNPKSAPENRKYIALTVGRLDRLKGHSSAIAAIKRLIQKGIEIEYWIVGSGFHDSSLREEVRASGMEDNVKMLGLKSGDDLKALYQKAHFFILPSITEPGAWAETQGIVVQEAQASGVLTVCSRSGGIPECIEDGEDGFLYEQGNSEDLADKLDFLIFNSSNWRHWQDNARQSVEEKYSLEKMANNLKQLYERG